MSLKLFDGEFGKEPWFKSPDVDNNLSTADTELIEPVSKVA